MKNKENITIDVILAWRGAFKHGTEGKCIKENINTFDHI